jgi:hypothetical protein
MFGANLFFVCRFKILRHIQRDEKEKRSEIPTGDEQVPEPIFTDG